MSTRARMPPGLVLLIALALPFGATAQQATPETGSTTSSVAPQTAPIPTDADGLPQWQHTSVNDFARVLTPDDTRAIDEALIALHRDTGVQGTVVTLPALAPFGVDDAGFEDFSARLFNRWGVGDKTRNDGFMVLMSHDPRAARIQLGRAYSAGAELWADDIMQQVMLPAFRQDQPSTALRTGTMAIISQIARPVAAGQDLTGPEPESGNGDRIAGGIFALIAAGMGLAIWRDRRRRNQCPQCGHIGLVDGSATPMREDRPDGGWITRANSVTRHCPNCGWETLLTLPMSSVNYYDRHGTLERSDRLPSPHRSSGSSGFGGGSTGGRGASGRW